MSQPAAARITLSLIFDERLKYAVISHPRLGPKAWQDWVSRLASSNIVAPTWPGGSPPPPVVVDMPGEPEASVGEGDVRPESDARTAKPARRYRLELARIPQETIYACPLKCELTFDAASDAPPPDLPPQPHDAEVLMVAARCVSEDDMDCLEGYVFDNLWLCGGYVAWLALVQAAKLAKSQEHAARLEQMAERAMTTDGPPVLIEEIIEAVKSLYHRIGDDAGVARMVAVLRRLHDYLRQTGHPEAPWGPT